MQCKFDLAFLVLALLSHGTWGNAMATLIEQLRELGFSADFTPEITGEKWREYKDPNLGKTGYIYFEEQHPKGTFKKFIYTVYKVGGHKTILEWPDQITSKEKKSLESSLKNQEITWKQMMDARHTEAAIAAQEKLDQCVNPKLLPAYLESKGLNILEGYKVDPDSVDTMYIPMYGKDGKLQSYQNIFKDFSKDFQAGGKAQGSFGLLEGGGDTLYIAEGFATAASAYLCTGQSVAFVLSAGNFEAAIRNILTTIRRDYVVILADNDIHLKINTGLIKAKEAAEKFGFLLKIPKFKNNDGKNTTDFDDVRRLEGNDELKKQITISHEEKVKVSDQPGVVPYGHKDGVYYYSSSENPTIQSFTSFSKENCFKLMKEEFWEKRYGEMGKMGLFVPWDTVASELMAMCHQKGIYKESNHRGIGVHLDEKRVVIHLGDRLLVDDIPMSIRAFKSKYNYIYSGELDPINEEQLTDEECRLFSESFDNITLTERTNKHYILGWIVCSIISGALEWRPHIYITGKQGSGKTQLSNLIHKIFKGGWIAFYTQGIQSTPVGVRQAVQSNSIPVMIDEVEGMDKKISGQAQGYISLCRGASSNSDAMTVIGSQSQKATSYKVSFCAWLSGITPQVTHIQDRERFVQVQMTKKENGNKEEWDKVKKYWASIDQNWSKKLVSRILNNIPTILENIHDTIESISDLGNNRFADQYGTLLGASLLFSHTNKASKEEVENLKNILLLKDMVEDKKKENLDEMECLNHILEGTIIDDMNQRTTVQRELTKSDISERMQEILADFGIIIKEIDGKKGLHIRSTNALKKHMVDLPQYSVNFVNNTLPRVKGAKSKVQTRAFGRNFRGTWIPFSSFMEEPTPEKVKGVSF